MASTCGRVDGLDGVADGVHVSSATALEETQILRIPDSRLNDLAGQSTNLLHVVGRLMSREIVREHSLMLLLGSMNAEERLAAFLLNMSQRLKARGDSPSGFHLRMSRAEIGSYLGMKLETVSRTFSSFQQQRLLEVDKRHIRILNLERLTRSSNRHSMTMPPPVIRSKPCLIGPCKSYGMNTPRSRPCCDRFR